MQADHLADFAQGHSSLSRPFEALAALAPRLLTLSLDPLEGDLSGTQLGAGLLLGVLCHRAKTIRRVRGYVSRMADPFTRGLAENARILVEFEGRPLARYAIMLQLLIDGRWQTIRLFDNAHGDHDMHRYTGSEKQPAERFAEGAVNEIAPQAIDYLIEHWEAIADSWRS